MRIYREERSTLWAAASHPDSDPCLHGLYWVLQSSVEIRNAPWIGWIHDLSVPDPFFILPLLMTLSRCYRRL